jgi:DNA-binding response OmpR family regulator
MVGSSAHRYALSDPLLDEGFEPVLHADATGALKHINQHGLPHLAIVDLRLPDMDGVDLCKHLMSRADVPIIVIADRDAPGQAARALQYADDYLREPVAPDELVMRIRRILSRIGSYSYTSEPQLRVCDDLTIDFQHRLTIVNGQTRKLTPTENALLQVLVRHRGKVMEADILIEWVWRSGITISDRNALRVHMHRLRHKVERDPDAPRMIQTERGIGYVFIGC